MKIKKQSILILILIIFFSFLLTMSSRIYAQLNITDPTLHIYAQVLYYGEFEKDLETKKLIIEILGSDINHQEIFENYIINDGWINVELGLDPNNPLDPRIFDTKDSKIKISIEDELGSPPSSIIAINNAAKTVFSHIAAETPTGNLFPSILGNQNKVLVVNDTGDSFNYLSIETILNILNYDKNEIAEFFNIEQNDNKYFLIIKDNKYEKISITNLYDTLELNTFVRDNVVPKIEGNMNKVLQVDETGTHFVFTDLIQTIDVDEVRATMNLFAGEGSNINKILLWNDIKNVFEAQPIDTLQFFKKSDLNLSYNNQTNEISLGNQNSINIGNLKDNTDSQDLEFNSETTKLSITGASSEIYLVSQFVINDELNNTKEALIEKINSINMTISNMNLALDANNNLKLLNTESEIDLNRYIDNTDNQQLGFNEEEGILMLDNSVSINLKELGANIGTDDQILSYNPINNTLTLENSSLGDINLSHLKDNTDVQTLSMSGSILSVTRTGTVNSEIDFLDYLGNAATANIGIDVQGYSDHLTALAEDEVLDIANINHGEYMIKSAGEQDQLWVANENGIGDWQEPHQLSLTNGSLSLLGSNSSVDLNQYQQILSVDENFILHLSPQGGSVNLSVDGDGIGSDEQTIKQFYLSENKLILEFENAEIVSVNLTSLDTKLTADEIMNLGYIKSAAITQLSIDYAVSDNELEGQLRDAYQESNNVQTATLLAGIELANQEQIATLTAGYELADQEQIETLTAGYELADQEKIVALTAGYELADQEKIATLTAGYEIADQEKIVTLTAGYESADQEKITMLTEAYKVADEEIVTELRSLFEAEDILLNNMIDNLDISLSGDLLTLTNGSNQSVDLSNYRQTITFDNNYLTISNGSSINFGATLGNDNQLITEFSITSNILKLTLDNGGVLTANLSSLDTTLTEADISEFNYIKIDTINNVIAEFESEDTENITTLTTGYELADQQNINEITNDYQVADDVMEIVLIDGYQAGDRSTSASIMQAYQLADQQLKISITEEYVSANEDQISTLTQAYIIADDTMLENLREGYINNDEIISINLTQGYRDEDIKIKSELTQEYSLGNSTQEDIIIANYINADAVMSENIMMEYLEADEQISSNIHTAYQLADDNVSANFTAEYKQENQNQTNRIRQAYQSKDNNLQTMIMSEQAYIIADNIALNTLTSNYTTNDINLLNSIKSEYQSANVIQNNLITNAYEAQDSIIRENFENSDAVIENRIENLNLSLGNDHKLRLINDDTVITEINLSSLDQELSIDLSSKELTITDGGSVNLSAIDTNLSEDTIRSYISEVGFLTSLNGVNWNTIVGIPSGFADGVDYIHYEEECYPSIGGETPPCLVPAVNADDVNNDFTLFLSENYEWDTPLKKSEIEALGFLTKVTAANIEDDAVDTSKIDNNAITGEEIVADAVTEQKIADGAITSIKISDNTVKSADIGTLSDGKIISIDWADVTGKPETFSGSINGNESSPTLVPTPSNDNYYLQGDGTWVNLTHNHNYQTADNHSHDNLMTNQAHGSTQYLTQNEHNNLPPLLNKSDHDDEHNNFAVKNHGHVGIEDPNEDDLKKYLNGTGNYSEFPTGGDVPGPETRPMLPWFGYDPFIEEAIGWIGYISGHSVYDEFVAQNHTWGNGHNTGGDNISFRIVNSSYDDDTIAALRRNGSWIGWSDKRLKTNISTIKDALQKIKNIRGVRYQRKNENNQPLGDYEVGVIAQEVQKDIPEIVRQNSDDEFLTVNYGALTALLVQGIKELSREKNQEIISLNTQLDEYDKQINVELNELKTKNKKLKKTLAKLTETLNYLEAKRVVK